MEKTNSKNLWKIGILSFLILIVSLGLFLPSMTKVGNKNNNAETKQLTVKEIKTEELENIKKEINNIEKDINDKLNEIDMLKSKKEYLIKKANFIEEKYGIDIMNKDSKNDVKKFIESLSK